MRGNQIRAAFLTLIFSLVAVVVPRTAQAQGKESASNSRVFLLTATYGVVAGTLTGLGSLAFYNNPSEHSRNIAMGASIGLYVGLLLGAYMVYTLPEPGSKKEGDPGRGGAPATQDPLRLESKLAKPLWAPYFAYNEKSESMVVGVSYLY